MTAHPPRRRTAVDTVERAMRDAILRGEFPRNASLPREADLAVLYDVNRGTLRAAIARLAQAGLVEIHHGRTARVRDWWTAGPAVLAALPIDRDVAEDLLALRRALAQVVLERLAARPPSAEARKAIEEAVGRLALAFEQGDLHPVIVDRDLAVTRALVRATGRPALALSLNPVLQLLADLPTLSRAMYRDPASNVAGWRLVLAWLEHPDPAGIQPVLHVLAERDAATLSALA